MALSWDQIVSEAEKMQQEIMTLKRELDNKTALYKAFTKTHLGMADNEPTDVLSLAKAMKLVHSR